MYNFDFSYEESLCRQHKLPAISKAIYALQLDTPLPYWIELINDLVLGAGYSYSRIAYRIEAAPSTIQKLARNPNRKPRLKILHPLIGLHAKVFEGPYSTQKARDYWINKTTKEASSK